MSTENVETARHCVTTFLAGDFEAAFALMDPEIEFDVSIRPEGKAYRGYEGVIEAAQTWTDTWEDWTLEIEEMIDAGEQVIMVDRQSGRGRDSGIPLSQQTAWVFSFRGGRVVRMVWFPTRDAGLEAAGLAE